MGKAQLTSYLINQKWKKMMFHSYRTVSIVFIEDLQKENQPAQNIRLFLNSSKKKRSFQEYLLTTIFDDLKIGYTTSNIEEDEILGSKNIVN